MDALAGRESWQGKERRKGIQANQCGGATIFLSGGFRLVIFPDCSEGEDWRIFCCDGVNERHFVIEGGTIEEE
jgi:hypothetical protein